MKLSGHVVQLAPGDWRWRIYRLSATDRLAREPIVESWKWYRSRVAARRAMKLFVRQLIVCSFVVDPPRLAR